MNKLSYSLIGALVLSAYLSAPVGSETLSVSGKLIANICSVDIGNETQTVPLGSVSDRFFHQAGDVSSSVGFTIALTACGQSASAATISFSGVQDATNPQLLGLTTTAGDAANGIGIEILDATGKTISIQTNSDPIPFLVNENGDATLNFKARYKATQNVVRSGSANATTEFILSYQ